MVTVARIPHYTDRLDSAVCICKFAEDAVYIDSIVTLVQSAIDQVTLLLFHFTCTAYGA
jgi:hypothetical protein